ncbi:MAG: hypothetical protein ACRD7E_12105, partial [Bryobacteraceae bacterium]
EAKTMYGRQLSTYQCHRTLREPQKVPGIKIHDTWVIRLMEVFLHSGTKITGWRTAEVHEAILTSFGLKPAKYTLTQLRYDIHKMKAHGLVERHGRRYAYQLTDKGIKLALMFVLFHQRVCDPLANRLFEPWPVGNHLNAHTTRSGISQSRSVYSADFSAPRSLTI